MTTNRKESGIPQVETIAEIVVAETAPNDADHPVVINVEIPAVAQQKRRVLIVDDELVGMKFWHLPDDVKQLLDDITSPQVAELWQHAMHIRGFRPLEDEDLKVIRGYITSDEIVSDVILTEYFLNNATELLKAPLRFFLERANSVKNLRTHIETAFPDHEFEIKFLPARPSVPTELLNYDLIMFDLVLQSSRAAVDEMVEYLGALGRGAYPARLPCVIVMSSHAELIEHQIRFSTESNISAAGLLILPKSEVAKDTFGSLGLELSYQQLDRQRDIAHQMRAFMRTWTDALEKAKERAAEAMWNLDAAAMQELHLVSHNDHDPYDEYLNALMSREYLWHVESAQPVADAISALDACFQAQFKEKSDPAEVRQRFIAPFVNPQHGRTLVSHFTWAGMPLPQKLSDVATTTAVRKFNRLVPFGALLAPEVITPDTECLVHITQQCDLNQKKDGQSAQFAVVLPTLVQDYDIKAYDSDDLVARGLRIGDKEYDFRLAKGRQLALPIALFVKCAKRKRLSVVGRLRHDIATHFLLATANHMTRWASQKVDHVETLDVTLYLHGEKFPDGHVLLTDRETGNPQIVQIAKTSKKRIYFQDNTSIRVALWIAHELKTHYGENDLDIEIICNQLSVGLKNNECLSKFVHLKHSGIRPADRKAELSVDKSTKKKVNLVCVFDPEAIS